MARINTYRLDDIIRSQDIVLGSSYEGETVNGSIYSTRNYRLSDLARFFQAYDFNIDVSLVTLEGLVNQNILDISDLDSSLTALSGRVTVNEADILQGQLDISSILGRVTVNEGDIVSLQGNVNSALSSITTLDNSLTSTIARVTTNESSISTINSNIANRSNWDAAFSWGNHATQGYLTSAVLNETDPIFTGSPAAGISSTNIQNWTSAYNDSITGISVTTNDTGSQKTITLTRRSGASLSDAFTDIFSTSSGGITDTNNYVDSASFDIATGTLTLGRLGLTDLTVSNFNDLYYTKNQIDSASLNYALLSGNNTFTGANTLTGAINLNNQVNILNFTSIVDNERFRIQPSDYGVGNPKLYIRKDLTPDSYTFGLYDTVDNSGLININADLVDIAEDLNVGASLTVEGVSVFSGVVTVNDITDVDSISFSPSVGTANANEIMTWLPRDNSLVTRNISSGSNWPAGNGQFLAVRGGSASGTNGQRTFSFWRSNNQNELYYGTLPADITTPTWTWNRLAHENSQNLIFSNKVAFTSGIRIGGFDIVPGALANNLVIKYNNTTVVTISYNDATTPDEVNVTIGDSIANITGNITANDGNVFAG